MTREDVRVFKALSDPSRLRIVKMLGERELCLCEVREVLGLSTSTVSKHLTILRDANLILDAKVGKWVNFRLNPKSENSVARAALGVIHKEFLDDAVIREDARRLRNIDRQKICQR